MKHQPDRPQVSSSKTKTTSTTHSAAKQPQGTATSTFIVCALNRTSAIRNYNGYSQLRRHIRSAKITTVLTLIPIATQPKHTYFTAFHRVWRRCVASTRYSYGIRPVTLFLQEVTKLLGELAVKSEIFVVPSALVVISGHIKDNNQTQVQPFRWLSKIGTALNRVKTHPTSHHANDWPNDPSYRPLKGNGTMWSTTRLDGG